MDKKTLRALRGSIRKWHKIAYHEKINRGVRDCPLCRQFHSAFAKDVDYDDSCSNCPVQIRTGEPYCYETPYIKYTTRASNRIRYAIEERDFLISLLPPGKTVTLDGEQYYWEDE